MKRKPSATKPARRFPSSKASLAEWERGWQTYWKNAGFSSYELPASNSQAFRRERNFLTQTRTPARERARLKRITTEFERGFKKLHQLGPTVTVFGSARFEENHPYYRLGRATGAELAKAGFTVLTGGGPGIMEAANRGAQEVGGATYGLNIMLPEEQEPNPFVNESIEFHYFFVRKVMLVKYSCAFIILPGGLGTLDELFESATLIQCEKIGPFPLILMGSRFWDGMIQFWQFMMQEGVFREEEIGFGRVTDSPREAVDLIVRSLPPGLRRRLKPLRKR